jgi:hypothetical protein
MMSETADKGPKLTGRHRLLPTKGVFSQFGAEKKGKKKPLLVSGF